MALDFSADQSVIDNLEPVTVVSTRNSGDIEVEVADASRYEISLREAAASEGAYQAGDVVWTVRRAALDAIGYKPGDRVVDADDESYTVLSAVAAGYGGFVRLTTRNLALANDLSTTGDLTRPTNATDAAGRAALTTYTTVLAGIRCLVQPEESRAGDTLGRRTTPKHYTAYLAVQVDARAKDVFVSGGVRYTVLGYHAPERIDQLPYLDLELIR